MTHINFSVAALDCPDPLELANFYARLTGLEVEPLGDFPPGDVTWIELLSDGGPTIGFQKVPAFVAPTCTWTSTSTISTRAKQWPSHSVPASRTSSRARRSGSSWTR